MKTTIRLLAILDRKFDLSQFYAIRVYSYRIEFQGYVRHVNTYELHKLLGEPSIESRAGSRWYTFTRGRIEVVVSEPLVDIDSRSRVEALNKELADL